MSTTTTVPSSGTETAPAPTETTTETTTSTAPDAPAGDEILDGDGGEGEDGEGGGEEGDGGEEILSVAKEELDAIKADPNLRKLYKGMTRAYTQRLTALAQDRQVAEAVRSDPANAARTLAKIAGLKIEDIPPAQPGQQTADALTERFAKLVGRDAALALKPVIEEIARSVVIHETNPLKEVVEADRTTALNARSEAEVTAFKAKHPDVTGAVEKQMVALAAKIPPGTDVTPDEYLGYLRTIVLGGATKTDATKEVVTRMKAAGKQEATSTAPSKVAPANDDLRGKKTDDAWNIAFERAMQKHGA